MKLSEVQLLRLRATVDGFVSILFANVNFTQLRFLTSVNSIMSP